MVINRKISVILVVLIVIFICFLYIFIFNDVNKKIFIVKNWYTTADDSATILVIEFESELENGNISLYSPSGRLIDTKNFNKKIDNVSFLISKNRYVSYGNHSLVIYQNDNRIFEDYILLKNANITIKNIAPKWIFNEVDGYFSLFSFNITLINSGDIFGQIWEGKLIIDDVSSWPAPNKHWHDLDIWIPPNDNLFIELVVDMPYFQFGAYNASILLIDKNGKMITLFEDIIFTPNI